LVVGGWWFVVGGKSILSERATNPTHSTHHQPPTTNRPWHRELTRDQWRAFAGAFLGWTFDGFDFTVLTFILIDIQRAFGVDAVLAGALGTVTLLMRLVGGVCAGAAADKWGRKTPLMLSILWFSLFAFLSAFSTSYAMLFAIRALFGIGMGGVWAAGMPLALEHWPAHLRGTASGMLQGGFAWGFILAALAFRFIYPAFQAMPDLGWRVMFGIGLLPALLVPWIHARVSESPIWLERREHLRATGRQETAPVIRLFQRALVGTTIQCAALMSAFMFSYYSIVFWYATLLRGRGIEPLVYLVTLNLGQALGNPVWGRISDGSLGRRGAVAVAALLGVAGVPLFALATDPIVMWLGAVIVGVCGVGIWGMAPTYLTERFPTAVRGVGPGFSVHFGAAVGSLTPSVIGFMQERGMPLGTAMALLIAISGLTVAGTIWLGPETRGRVFSARE
jgi:SHS family lactate transporter-like MFS transporter